METDDPRVLQILDEVRRLATEYYDLTGKPLGVTGEVAEYEAARLLGMKLRGPRETGYDAIWKSDKGEKRVQIKGRRVVGARPNPGARVGRIHLNKPWDAVVLVLLDRKFHAVAIYEALRPAIESCLTKPGSKARNERGQLSISQFKACGHLVWRTGANDRATQRGASAG